MHKNGYLFKIFLKIEELPTYINSYLLVCSWRYEKPDMEYVYLLLNDKYFVMGCSSNSLIHMELTKQMIEGNQWHIKDLFPQLEDDVLGRDQMINIEDTRLTFINPYITKQTSINSAIIPNNEELQRNSLIAELTEGRKIFNCKVRSIKEEIEGSILGFVFMAKLRDINWNSTSHKSFSINSLRSKNEKDNLPNFQFSYIPELNQFIGEPLDPSSQSIYIYIYIYNVCVERTRVEIGKMVDAMSKRKKYLISLSSDNSVLYPAKIWGSDREKAGKSSYDLKGVDEDRIDIVECSGEDLTEIEFDERISRIIRGSDFLSGIIVKLQQQYIYFGQGLGFKSWLVTAMELPISQLLVIHINYYSIQNDHLECSTI